MADPKAEATAKSVTPDRLLAVLDSLGFGFWYSDLPLGKLIWNDRTKEHFGLHSDAEVTIDTFYERLLPEDRDKTRQGIQHAIEHGSEYDAHYRILTGTGSARWIRFIGHCFHEGGSPVRFDGITLDISAQKDVEQTLREREHSYKVLLQHEEKLRSNAELLNRVGPLLAAELDPRKLIQSVTDVATVLAEAEFGAFFYNPENPSREAFAGFPMQRNAEVFGLTFRGEGAIRLEDITQDPRYGNNPPYAGLPEGQVPVRSYMALPMISRSGEVLGGLFFGHSRPGVFTGEHEQLVAGIAAMAAIAVDNARLFEQARRDREKAEGVQSILRASNDELQRFAYVASHDLQEPLRSVASFSQLLAHRYRGQLGPDADEYIHYIVAGAHRMSTLIQDLLDYARIVNTEALQILPVSLEKVFSAALVNLQSTIRDSGAVITHDPLPTVSGDEFPLVQLMQNLLSNSIKYRGDEPPRIHVKAVRSRNEWMVSVQDNGIGIEPEYLDRIFGVFKRLHGKEVPGTGIGLAICKRIVEKLGGRIWAESIQGQGSTFYFAVPA